MDKQRKNSIIQALDSNEKLKQGIRSPKTKDEAREAIFALADLVNVPVQFIDAHLVQIKQL